MVDFFSFLKNSYYQQRFILINWKCILNMVTVLTETNVNFVNNTFINVSVRYNNIIYLVQNVFITLESFLFFFNFLFDSCIMEKLPVFN